MTVLLHTPESLASTAPAPGTGYSDPSSWWKDPLSDLIGGAAGKLEEAIGVDERETIPPAQLTRPALQAGIAPADIGIGGGVALLGGLALLALMASRR